MDKIITKLTVFFDDPFWVGVYERELDGKYEVCKITFGAEPKDYEVLEFLLKNYTKLRFSPNTEASLCSEKKINPKRMQRAIKNQLQSSGVGTKAQQALKLQHEQSKALGKSISREQREEQKKHLFVLHQQKRKEKHKGH